MRASAACASAVRGAEACVLAITSAITFFWGTAATMYSSIRLRMRASRAPAEVPPITTDTMCLLLRRTEATRLKPDAWV